MSDDLRQEIYNGLSQKETDELVEIWRSNDHTQWTDMGFEVIREILQARLGKLPPQNVPVYGTNGSSGATMTLGQLYFSLNGRIGRQTYWLKGALPLLALSAIAGIVDALVFPHSGYSGGPTRLLWQLLILWPSLALTVKRWHDLDKSGWWILIGLIPIVGTIWAFLETGFLKGTEGPNRFGLKAF